MSKINDKSVVKQQYATANNLNTRISIHDKYSTNLEKGLAEVQRVLKNDGIFYCATYGEHGIIEYLSKILSEYGVKDNTNKNFTLQNGYEVLSKTFSKVKKVEYIDSLAVTNIDDMVEYICSLSGMTSLNSVPKQVIKDSLEKNTTDGILNVPKEYGMFISSNA